MAYSKETDLKKKALLKQNQKSPQIMSIVAKEIIESNTKVEGLSTDFSNLAYRRIYQYIWHRL